MTPIQDDLPELQAFHNELTLGLFGLGVMVALVLLVVSAPYGRHIRNGWGPTIPSRLGWVLMELPSPAFFLYWYLQGSQRSEVVPLICLALWLGHYGHRTFVFPFRARLTGKRMPVLVALLAVLFNVYNAYINAHWVAHYSDYHDGWLMDPRCLGGLALFAFGMWLNITSDNRLLALRKPGETGYKIPYGGGFRYVSAPNYLGELVEWCGWALLTWSLAGAAFAFFTAANLIPRALSNHRWYQNEFPDYPPERRAVIPFLL